MPGPAGPPGPAGTAAVSANVNNKATLGTDNLILVQGAGVATAATTHAQTVSGDDPQLTNARAPTSHGGSHLQGQADPIPLVTLSSSGLCVPPDGNTINISAGKLVATGGGGGGGASATVSVSFNVPPINMVVANVSISNANWMLVNQSYFIVGIGVFLCTAISANLISLQNTGMQGNATSGTNVPVGALIMPVPDQMSNVLWEVDEMCWNAPNNSLANNAAIGPWVAEVSSANSVQGGALASDATGNSIESADVGLNFTTSTSATGYGYVQHNGRSMFAGTGGGNNCYLFHFRMRMNPTSTALSSATDRYLIFLGLYDATPTGTVQRRITFTYTDAVQAGNWSCDYQKNTGTNTQNNSNVAVVLNTWYDLYLIIDPINIYWLIGQNNAAPVQVFTTVIANASWSNSNGFYAYIGIQKSVGTTARTFLFDLFERAVIWKYATVPRYSFRGLIKTGS